MTYRFLFLILALITLSTAQTTLKCTVSATDTVTIGQSSVFCLHFNFIDNNVVASTKSYAFPAAADEFSVLQVTGIKQQINKHNSVTVEIQFQNRNDSIVMNLWNSTGQYYRAVFSVVANIDSGTCTGLTEDNENCDWCNYDGFTCVDGKCYRSGSVYNGPDPKFYLTWIGTDSNNDHFLSQAKRLSRFNQYSVGSVYKEAQNFS